jgi:hypothetical protein
VNIAGPALPAIFKFAGQTPTRIALCVLALWWAFFCVIWIRRGGSASGATFLLISLLFVLLISGLTLTSQSDVVIDDQGISKRLFGVTLRTIRWDNVREVRVFQLKGIYAEKMIRALAIYPAVGPKGNLSSIGKLVIRERFEKMDLMIEMMNHYISKYGIRIVIEADGSSTVASHL